MTLTPLDDTSPVRDSGNSATQGRTIFAQKLTTNTCLWHPLEFKALQQGEKPGVGCGRLFALDLAAKCPLPLRQLAEGNAQIIALGRAASNGRRCGRDSE
jgi:hypothetical protein